MIGYLLPYKEKLTLQERKIFRNYYCSLCLSLKYNYGNVSRLFIIYDIAFLMLLTDKGLKIDNCGKCGKYIENCKNKFRGRDFSIYADLNILMIRKKIEDDKKDKDHFFRNALLKAILSRKIKLCKKRNPKINEIIDCFFAKYDIIEKKENDPEFLALEYGRIMAEMFDSIFELSVEKNRLIALICSWTLIVDAIDDYEQDLRRKRVNIFGGFYGNKKNFIINNIEYLRLIFDKLRLEIKSVYSKITFNDDIAIVVNNILFDRMPFVEKHLFELKQIKKEKLL